MSYSSIRLTRWKRRAELTKQIKENYQPQVPLTIHWDGKILPNNHGTRVDHLPIVVSGVDISQILDVPVLSKGTASAEANAICATINSWNIRNNITAMCFDTTAVNTGVKNGIIQILPKLLKKELLALACRHHVAELVLKAAFEIKGDKSRSSQLDDFSLFRKEFKTIDKSYINTIDDCHFDIGDTRPWRDEIIEFCQEKLQESHPRGDYEELLELTLMFLGGTPPKGKKFRAPGAISRARWMARAIYAIKIFMLKDYHTKVENQTIEHYGKVAVFIAQCYIKYWFQAAIPSSAPRTDLELLQSIKKFPHKEYSNAAINTFKNHLWYLSKVNVGLAFFDAKVSIAEKERMIKALKTSGKTENTHKAEMKEIDSNLTISSIVSSNTLKFFKILNIETDFLQYSPTTWNSLPSYQNGKKIVAGMQVVNDIAERAVKLVTDYNGKLTHDPDQQQYLLKVVEYHRKQFPLKR